MDIIYEGFCFALSLCLKLRARHEGRKFCVPVLSWIFKYESRMIFFCPSFLLPSSGLSKEGKRTPLTNLRQESSSQKYLRFLHLSYLPISWLHSLLLVPVKEKQRKRKSAWNERATKMGRRRWWWHWLLFLRKTRDSLSPKQYKMVMKKKTRCVRQSLSFFVRVTL